MDKGILCNGYGAFTIGQHVYIHPSMLMNGTEASANTTNGGTTLSATIRRDVSTTCNDPQLCMVCKHANRDEGVCVCVWRRKINHFCHIREIQGVCVYRPVMVIRSLTVLIGSPMLGSIKMLACKMSNDVDYNIYSL